jgi:hypothetical protein
MGGSGSTYLINELNNFDYAVQGREDYLFVPDIYLVKKDTVVDDSSISQIINNGDYSVKIKVSSIRSFYNRINRTVPKYDVSVSDVVLEYIRELRHAKKATAVFCYLAMAGFFSKYMVKDVIYLIRHPLHAYVSLAGHQHPHLSATFGGLNTKEAVEWYANVWNSVTSEYLKCRRLGLNHHVLRYCFCKSDSRRLPINSRIFNNLKHSKRNAGVLSVKYENLLHKLTERNYNNIYGDYWGI